MAGLEDKFRKVGTGTVTTMAAPGKAEGASSINVGSSANYPTDTGVIITIRTVDASGDLVAGTQTEWKGVVASDTSITIDPVPVYGSDQVYAAGSTTQVLISLSSYAHNDLMDALTEMANGWNYANETWTYVNATTILTETTPSSAKYSVGDKIRLKQGGAYKFFIIYNVSASVASINVTAGTDNVVADAAITDNYYSKGGALGHPFNFNYLPVLGGTAADIGNGTVAGRFSINGRRVAGEIYIVAGSTTNLGSATTSFSLPITSLAISGTFFFSDSGYCKDQSTGKRYTVVPIISDGSGTLSVVVNDSTSFLNNTVPFTVQDTDIFAFSFHFEI